jgi:hypothetical protein
MSVVRSADMAGQVQVNGTVGHNVTFDWDEISAEDLGCRCNGDCHVTD